jgi:hypothetical protein
MASLTNKYLQRWKNNEVALHSRVTLSKEVGVISQYRYIMISEGFINDYYKAKSFPNSLVYLSACQGLRYPTRLAKTLVDKGVGVVIGWTGNNSIGRNTCYSLVSSLLDGKSVGESFDLLPDMEKKDYNTQYFSFPIMQYLLNLMGIGTPPRAELAYYPPEGKDMHLLEGPKYIGVWNYYFDYYEGGWTMAGTIEIKQGGNATIHENLEYPHHVCNGTWSLGKNDLGEESILIEFIGEVYPHTEYPGNWYRYDITYDGCYGYDYQTKTISGRMLYHSFHKYEANPWEDTGISSGSCELRKE